MAALQKSSREERLVGLKEVARELPEANLLLLNTLLRLLQNISSNATVSKMTASNLAICVGPNLLGPPEEDTLPLDTLVQATAKVTQLVEFLINHREELFEAEEEREEEEEGAGLAAEGAEESPAAGAEAESAEVGEVHKQRERMPPPSEGGIAAAGTSKFIHPPAALHECRVRLMQVGHHSLCSDPSRSGTAGLSKAIQGICLLELSWKMGRAHLLRFHCRCLQSLQKAKARIAPLGRAACQALRGRGEILPPGRESSRAKRRVMRSPASAGGAWSQGAQERATEPSQVGREEQGALVCERACSPSFQLSCCSESRKYFCGAQRRPQRGGVHLPLGEGGCLEAKSTPALAVFIWHLEP
ncbi:uncharacterized protein LOC135578812 [Columba livia]|uniref:uncharacterized protein LOC135578812 n=1 Tax=Columba livia TaxID=8932 RepID=UPI0031BA91D2